MEELAELNPTPNPASSPLLQGTWDVVWTTEAELLALTSNGFLGLTRTLTLTLTLTLTNPN